MIYITVNRVESKKHGRGINIYLHRHATMNQQDPWQVLDDPGPADKGLVYKEIPPGINRVEAYLDLFCEDADYSRETVNWALDIVAQQIEDGVTNPAKIRCEKDGRVIVYVAYSVNQVLLDLTSRRWVFNDLRKALRRWEMRHDGEIVANSNEYRAAM